MRLLQNQKQIGLTQIKAQAISFIILTKGVGLLFLQALSEPPGWVMLTLWIAFNFLGLVLLINLADKLFPSTTSFWLSIKFVLIGLIAGILGFLFNLIYYRYHFYYIGEDFNPNDFKDNFLDFIVYLSPIVILGELIRRYSYLLKKLKLLKKPIK